MALVKCAFCGREISDKSCACVHCGGPVPPKGFKLKQADMLQSVSIACPECGGRCYGSLCKNCGYPLQDDKPCGKPRGHADILVDEAKEMYFKKKYGAAWNNCKNAEEYGNSEAQFMMGLLLAQGHQGPKQERAALDWYMKAAEKNNGAAINAIGVMYYNGKILPRDIKKAVDHFRRAYEFGDMFGAYNLAICFYHGIGVSKSIEEAKQHLYFAIKQGNITAMDFLESMIFNWKATNTFYEEDIGNGFVLSEECWGHIEKTYTHKGGVTRVLFPIFSQEFYRKNKKLIEKTKENYRRKQLYKLPELIIMA